MRKLTNEEVKQRMYSAEGDNYKLLSEYVNARTKIRVKHSLCGHEYEVKWGDFQRGVRCPKCAGRYRYTDSEISGTISEMTDGEYTKLSEYKNAHTKFKIRHEKCNFEYEVRWSDFRQGYRCPKCAGKHRHTDSEINKLVAEMTDGEYTKLSEYKNNYTKFSIRHNLCGHEYMVIWNNFQSGSRCPRCNQPKGEKFIEDYLTNHNISFATQVRFDDCRYKLPLPFDFAILDDNKRVIGLIEFDGEQHYKSVDFFGGEEALQQTQIRDAIKDNYCKAHKIPLLRIRFDENIEERLNLFLYKLKAPKSQREMEGALSTN